ncbi:MAG: zinc ribbon domain-containing protein [Ktedonobacterales bacterium]
MSSSERFCPNCGWQYEPAARMCGGCGMPLGTFGAPHRNEPSVPRRADGTPVTSTTTAGDAPTEYIPGGKHNPYAPTAGDPFSPSGAAPTQWPVSAAQPRPAYPPTVQSTRRRGGSCLQRSLLALLALVVVASCCGVGLWSFVFRPALHTATDSQIRSGLDAQFDDISHLLEQQLPSLPAGTYPDVLPIKAADINSAIQQAAAKKTIPTGSEVHFIGTDGVQVTYLFGGKPHTATTHLYVVNGRIRARDTADDFPINMWESNAELETTINEALTHLTPQLYVTELHMANDTLHFSFTK